MKLALTLVVVASVGLAAQQLPVPPAPPEIPDLSPLLMAGHMPGPLDDEEMLAQPGIQGPPGPQGPPPEELQGPGPPLGPEMTPEEINRIFDAYLVTQAEDALGLNDQQFAQFLSRLRVLQTTRRRNQRERMQIMGDLQRLTNPRNPRQGDEGLIKERLSALQELEARGAAELRKAYNALDEVLDVRQQARFRVFEEQIERKKLDLLLRVRQNAPRQNLPPGRGNQPPRRPPGGDQ